MRFNLSKSKKKYGALVFLVFSLSSCCLQKPEQLDVATEKFWAQEAEALPWLKKWDNVLDWQPPFAHWFAGGHINASCACLDQHIIGESKNKIAILWEDESGAKRELTYQELYELVNRTAAAMQKYGVKKGDVVTIYMPLIPEAIAAMLACARLGALHNVVFSGFGSDALRNRILDVQSKLIMTADFGLRRGKRFPIKDVVDKAIVGVTCVEHVVVVRREHVRDEQDRPVGHLYTNDQDIYFEDFIAGMPNYIAPEKVESNHPLFVLYTSGSTGKPKGIMHSTGGYLTYVYSTLKNAFGINNDSVYWCTADIGWITGHSYVVYGPLMHGATILLYDGSPDYPAPDVWWKLIERYNVSIFYTAPTALRLFIKYGDDYITKHNLESLKVLGSVGEPINPEVWNWYSEIIGCKRCPIIDTWWQTETGGFMIAPRFDMDKNKFKPGSAMYPMPGIDAAIVDGDGKEVPVNTKGFLVIRKPWPGMLLGFYSDQERYKKVYWSRFKNMYETGDYAIKDEDGCFWILGRSDEVIKIAGHRIGTAEVESAVVTHPDVAEAAAIGVDDELRGETVVIFAVLKGGDAIGHPRLDLGSSTLSSAIIARIHQTLGKFVVVSAVYFVDKLPKTRSGKILRRVLKAMAQNKPLGDLSTVEDDCVIDDVLGVYQNFQKMQTKKMSYAFFDELPNYIG
ncbi:MAG: acetate--CoA ligase [bacterium]